MTREHYDWRPQLEALAQTNQTAQKILEEGKTPGKYFDGKTHLLDTTRVLLEIKKDPGVKAIGIFGSRLSKEHEPLRSDIDIFVINDTPIQYDWSPSRGPSASRERHRYAGVGNGINIQECSLENWNKTAEGSISPETKTYRVMKSVRWLWIRPGQQIIPIP